MNVPTHTHISLLCPCFKKIAALVCIQLCHLSRLYLLHAFSIKCANYHLSQRNLKFFINSVKLDWLYILCESSIKQLVCIVTAANSTITDYYKFVDFFSSCCLYIMGCVECEHVILLPSGCWERKFKRHFMWIVLVFPWMSENGKWPGKIRMSCKFVKQVFKM